MKCVKCGRFISDNSKFCEYCGEPIQVIEESSKKTDFSRQKSAYSKCPFCGAIVGSFKVFCDSCGNEIKRGNTQEVIVGLSNALEKIDIQKQQHDGNYLNIFIKSVYGKGASEFDDVEKKVEIIKNYPIPNDRETLLELMVMASSNIDIDVYRNSQVQHSDTTERMNNAWLSKMKQIYQKAIIIFEPESTDFKRIEKIYQSTLQLVYPEKYEPVNNMKSDRFKDIAFWGIFCLIAIIFILLGIINWV